MGIPIMKQSVYLPLGSIKQTTALHSSLSESVLDLLPMLRVGVKQKNWGSSVHEQKMQRIKVQGGKEVIGLTAVLAHVNFNNVI